MDKKATVNILGTCVSRDSFSMHDNDGGYSILRYVNEFDPFYFTAKGIEIDKQGYDSYDVSSYIKNFRKRCMYLDATKTVMNYIKEADSDYLMIDAAAFRMPSLLVGNTCISDSRNRAKFFGELKEKGIIKETVRKEYRVPLEEFDERLDDFAGEVLSVYPPERIILLELRPTYLHSDGKKLTVFGGLDKVKEKSERCAKGFEVMRRKLAGCHVIPMPDAAVGDTNHWLGAAILHFTREFYDYVCKCVDVIVKKMPLAEEEMQIRDLHRQYTEYYYQTYFRKIEYSYANDISEKGTELLSEKRKTLHSDMQAKFLLEIALRGPKSTVPDPDIKTAVIYGWNRVSEYILKLLTDSGIKPVAVIENMGEATAGGEYVEGGVPVYKRGLNIPEADCIIVADLQRGDKIIEIIKKSLRRRVCSAEEFAGLAF